MDENIYGQILSKSGLANTNGVIVLNAQGVIDADYRDKIKVILFNTSNEDYVIRRGDAVAQITLINTNKNMGYKAENKEDRIQTDNGVNNKDSTTKGPMIVSHTDNDVGLLSNALSLTHVKKIKDLSERVEYLEESGYSEQSGRSCG
ncbi:deoxyuridine 5'-triphosphate nucleotidohydrolase-like [Hydra vulgaris]|uniref:Deoxyuridine 5'-triphosphate nucleotidohydrolase n=1 Tax=Hydra vulgaris TaxID=6087 RepID=A0ABM4DF86_HYDVU